MGLCRDPSCTALCCTKLPCVCRAACRLDKPDLDSMWLPSAAAPEQVRRSLFLPLWLPAGASRCMFPVWQQKPRPLHDFCCNRCRPTGPCVALQGGAKPGDSCLVAKLEAMQSQLDRLEALLLPQAPQQQTAAPGAALASSSASTPQVAAQ